VEALQLLRLAVLLLLLLVSEVCGKVECIPSQGKRSLLLLLLSELAGVGGLNAGQGP
jgi:hypothetical protein